MLSDPRLAVSQRARGKARYVLDQVLIKDPNRHEVRRCLVRLALDTRDLELAKEHLKYLQKALPDDGEVAGLLGQLQDVEGDETKALASLRHAVKRAPDSVENYVRLIQLLRRLDQGQRGPHFTEAEGLLAAALAKAADSTSVRLAAADLAQDRGDLAAARKHLERALQLDAREGRVHVAQARLELMSGKRDEAIAVLKRGLPAVHKEDRFEVRWTLANLLIDAGQLEAARQAIVQIQDENGSPGATDYLQARVQMQQGRWFEASRTLERVRNSFKSVPALMLQCDLLLGMCYEQLDDPARQLAACKRVLELDSASVPGRQGLAAALWALGQADQAIEQYRVIVKINQARKAPVTGRVELARLLLLRTMQQEPRNWQPVLEELDAAEKEQPGALDVALLRAEMFAADKKYDEAQTVLAMALQAQPRKLELWSALAGLLDRRGEPAKAQQLLDEAQKQLGDSVELRLARARLWTGRPREEAEPALRKLEAGWDAFPAEKQPALLNALAEMHHRLGNPADATRLWRKLAEHPRYAADIRLRMILFDLALQQRDDKGMRQVLDEIRTLSEGESAPWLLGQASHKLFLARQDHANRQQLLNQARILLDRVVQLGSGSPAVLLARAELEELQGNAELAITAYKRALEQGVRSPRVIRQLVQLLTARQRYDEAEQVMQQLAKQSPNSGELRKMQGDLLVLKGEFLHAEKLVNDAALEKSTDYRDHLWRGQMLAANKRKSPEAEKALRRAVELADTMPETWVALVQYLAHTEQTARALEEIEKARAKLAGPQAPLALAQCYEAVEQPDKAAEQYQAALAARPQEVQVRRSAAGFYLRAGRARDAEPHLRDILARKVTASEADVAWARRTLALSLASMADFRRFSEALALVGFSLDARGNVTEGAAPPGGYSVEEQVVRARVLATQTRLPLRLKAIALLEELHRKQALAPDEQVLLAQLYQSAGPDGAGWAKARDLMQGLVTTYPRNPMYLSVFAQSLLQNSDVREAERCVAKLEQLEKTRQAPVGAFGSVELKARALEARGKGAEALPLLKAYAEAPGAKPDRLLLYAGLFARLGQVKEAVDVCEQARSKCPPEAVGGASVAVLRTARPKPGQPEDVWQAQAARVEGWLKEAAEKKPDSVALLLQRADLMDLLGRPTEVQALYRQVLTKDERNHVALNNLAFLLAQRPEGAAEALALIQRAVETHGPRPEFLDTRAVIYLAMNQAEKAVADLEQAVADAPTPAKYFHQARAHHLARNPRAAREALARATAAGLTVERLHPAERDALRRLQAELKQ
jgi:tetratricopeptide (TPR) repeat protein